MRKGSIPASKWRWFGRSAHFICGEWCRFHMATLVGGYLVSTVGHYVPLTVSANETTERAWRASHPNGEEIGRGRTHETMVFRAGGPCPCGCETPQHDGRELDSDSYNNDKEAIAGHMAMCRKWATMKLRE